MDNQIGKIVEAHYPHLPLCFIGGQPCICPVKIKEKRKKLESKLTEYGKAEREAGRKFGNEENTRVKNSGRILYQTGFKDGHEKIKKEVIKTVKKYLHSDSDVFEDLKNLF